MRIWPAVDLMEGRAVQLQGGRRDRIVAEEDDPVRIAERFVDDGADGIHVVDLDRAQDEGDNLPVVGKLLDAVDVDLQVAGGLRDDGAVADVLGAGATRAVVGTRAVAEPAWLQALAARHPDRIVPAYDVRGGAVLTHGWAQVSDRSLADVAGDVPDQAAAVLCTDVDREGRQGGVDPTVFAPLVERIDVPVVAGGGIATLEDLDRLAKAGVAEAVVGSALYTGRLELTEVLDHVRT